MSDDDADNILSDEDYQKIAKDVKSLKTGGKEEFSIGLEAPRREQIIPSAPREEKIDLKERPAPAVVSAAPKPAACLFCKIVKKEIPARIVHENDDFLAFLDIQPKAVGHVVIVSKRHVIDMIDLDVAEQNSLNDVLQELCLRMKNRLKATGYTVVSSNGVSAGQVVPHFSMHVIPSYAANTVDLPLLNLIQPHKVPDFVMDDVAVKLSSFGTQETKKKDGVYKGFGVQ
ncbi:MAG: HIT family protein [archaeon]